ncbi:MAG TPA: glycosyl hydrolase family 18 protein [Solirubrobacteraceae bacterium]|nr:glycosyl hydrolase family 18 protein [Solirubrobacteraceae bacterium]
MPGRCLCAPIVGAATLALALLVPPAPVLAARPAGDRAAPPTASGAAPSPPASVLAAAPAEPLQAFVLAGAPDSFADLQAHVAQIGVIYPTYFRCAVPGGAVLGAPEPVLDAYSAAHDLAELPRFTCQDGATVRRILSDPALRAQTLAQLTALAGDPAYRGLNLDLENAGSRSREALSAFVAALAARLHAEHRQLTVDVVGVEREDPRHASYLYDDRVLAAAADAVFVMAWGIHWERSAPGPLAPLPYVRAVARRLAALPDAWRFVLGVPLYGLDWAGRGGGPIRPAQALQYAGVTALAAAVGAAPVRDSVSGEMTFAYLRAGVAHRVWYLDGSAVAQRVAIARRYGLSAGVWRLGEEDQDVWTEHGV